MIKNVLSLFDGLSCGQLALERAGIKYENYYASEIDKYAIAVTQYNYSNTIQLGSVTEVKSEDLPEIDLLIGGSPCQSFSMAGKRKGMVTKDSVEVLSLEQYLELKETGFEFEGQSYLFWEYVRLLVELKPKYFLLENVKMSQKWKSVLTEVLRKHRNLPNSWEAVEINSALVSAQNRRRLYWTNIPNVTQPKDRGILLKDILEININATIPKDNRYAPKNSKSNYIDPYNQNDIDGEKSTSLRTNCLTAANYDYGVVIKGCIEVGHATNINGHDILKRVYSEEGKSPSLNACTGGNREPKVAVKLEEIVCIKDELYKSREPRIKYQKSPTIRSNCGELQVGTLSPASITGRRINENGVREDNNPEVPISQCLQVNEETDKSRCLTIVSKDSVVSSLPQGRYKDAYKKLKENFHWRKLTCIECERLQTVPDNYTLAKWVKKTKHGNKVKIVSNSQRYKMLGNGWTVGVVAHIFKGLNGRGKRIVNKVVYQPSFEF